MNPIIKFLVLAAITALAAYFLAGLTLDALGTYRVVVMGG